MGKQIGTPHPEVRDELQNPRIVPLDQPKHRSSCGSGPGGWSCLGARVMMTLRGGVLRERLREEKAHIHPFIQG